jgi:hypothetical protein
MQGRGGNVGESVRVAVGVVRYVVRGGLGDKGSETGVR